MKQTILREIPLVLILLVPILYLVNYWDSIPETVPLHWNLQGQADRYGSKNSLKWVILLLPVLTYLFLLILPALDPKKKIETMGNKYLQLKYVFVSLMSILSVYIIYTAINQNQNTFNFIVSITALFFIFTGNFIKTIKPNYFLGVRTPWTLNNETVWKKTHEMTSILWIILGLFLLITLLTINNEVIYSIFLSVIVLAAIIPIIYSYFTSKSIIK